MFGLASSRASSLPQLIFSGHKICVQRWTPVGASLLAKAVFQTPKVYRLQAQQSLPRPILIHRDRLLLARIQ
jgi:hypothetical protein